MRDYGILPQNELRMSCLRFTGIARLISSLLEALGVLLNAYTDSLYTSAFGVRGSCSEYVGGLATGLGSTHLFSEAAEAGIARYAPAKVAKTARGLWVQGCRAPEHVAQIRSTNMENLPDSKICCPSQEPWGLRALGFHNSERVMFGQKLGSAAPSTLRPTL